jgi:hypothetical protein
MRLGSGLVAIVACVLVVPFSARAMMAEPKSIEVNGFFTLSHTSVSSHGESVGSTTFDLEPALGYFFTSNWEVLGKLIIDHDSGFGDNSGETHFGLTGDAFYHFNSSGSVVPFVGAGLGVLSNGGDANNGHDNSSIIVPELLAGVRFPFKEVVSVNATAGYRHTTSYRGFSDTSGNEFFLGAGFSFFFRGGIK